MGRRFPDGDVARRDQGVGLTRAFVGSIHDAAPDCFHPLETPGFGEESKLDFRAVM